MKILRLSAFVERTNFFDLCFIGSVGFHDHLIYESLASILFASVSLGGGCSDGVYQQIVKNRQKKNYFNS